MLLLFIILLILICLKLQFYEFLVTETDITYTALGDLKSNSISGKTVDCSGDYVINSSNQCIKVSPSHEIIKDIETGTVKYSTDRSGRSDLGAHKVSCGDGSKFGGLIKKFTQIDSDNHSNYKYDCVNDGPLTCDTDWKYTSEVEKEGTDEHDPKKMLDTVFSGIDCGSDKALQAFQLMYEGETDIPGESRDGKGKKRDNDHRRDKGKYKYRYKCCKKLDLGY